MQKHSQLIRDAVTNRLTSPTDITYVTDRSNWAVSSVAQDLVSTLNQSRLATARISTTSYGARNTILHFGSPYTYLFGKGVHATHSSNKVIVSVFHIPPDDTRIQRLASVQEKVAAFHVPASITRQQLLFFGIASEKIRCIPFGVNLDVYTPGTPEEKDQLRRELKIPKDAFVIGSFQKDGHGWGDGMEPKLVKGPDLFVEAMIELHKSIPVFVLLAGPARGYVRAHLEKNGIPYCYIGYQSSRRAIARAYHALDAYLISSRVEGGPLGLLEAWASGVPIVSTNVGMVADLGRHEENILIAEASAAGIAQATQELYRSKHLQKYLTQHARATARTHNWPAVAQRYYDRLYL